jgi:uncharacterized membrane protein YsdA (DUF1294 family)
MDPRKSAGVTGHPSDENRIRPWHLILLLALLVSPGLALHTYAVYGADKDSAQEKGTDWRASEKLLHGLEFAGGWPAAFLAQHRLRHKCSKLSYQVVFWLIVALHVCAATDYLLGWRIARAVGSVFLHGSCTP